MECMEGGELFNRIQQRNDNPYTERDAARYIWMIVQAVHHLHTMDIALKEFFSFTLFLVQQACDIWSMGVIMYILLCGYPPFFSEGGHTTSSGMESKIKAGDYQFPDAEWRNFSPEAKSTIQRMLTVDPAQRITINEILTCSWLTELTSNRPINMIVLQDAETRQQLEVSQKIEFLYHTYFNLFVFTSFLQAAVASATDDQRRTDDDLGIEISGPEASRIAKRAAKRNRHMAIADEGHH
ncbi:unnamed protein product [Rotaria sp. Silwood1]|nr:unnamed protein product [Rotaria sp. Silwood1]CAF3667200.1 unnamed protein product [Rotaria sp. Silwood1]